MLLLALEIESKICAYFYHNKLNMRHNSSIIEHNKLNSNEIFLYNLSRYFRVFSLHRHIYTFWYIDIIYCWHCMRFIYIFFSVSSSKWCRLKRRRSFAAQTFCPSRIDIDGLEFRHTSGFRWRTRNKTARLMERVAFEADKYYYRKYIYICIYKAID